MTRDTARETQREAELRNLVHLGDFKRASEVLLKPLYYIEAENWVDYVFHLDCTEKPKSAGFILEEAVLQGLLDSYPSSGTAIENHASWTCAASHITKYIWVREGLLHWVKKLNEKAFSEVPKIGRLTCACRFLSDFAHYSRWNETPQEMGIDLKNIRCWLKSPADSWLTKYEKERLVHHPFSSEESYEKWAIKRLTALFAAEKRNRPKTKMSLFYHKMCYTILEDRFLLGK